MESQPTHHELSWHTSYWPLTVSVGVLFELPLAFILYFVYQKPALAIISLGIGTPLIIASIIGWVKEGMADEHGYGMGLSVWAMPFFIVAEAMLFAGLFAGYWITRLTSQAWPPAGTPELSAKVPLIMTVLLVLSSFTIHMAEKRHEEGQHGGFLSWLIITMCLGTAFLGLSAFEWTEFIHHGFVFGTNIFASSFYSITGFHGSHVLVGLGLFLCALVPALRGKVNTPFVKAASIYWHFVDIVWFFVVSQIYFW